MSRLIDVDKLLEELMECHPLSLSYGILSDIEYFPTAYDVDKVIERLECEKNKCDTAYDDGYEQGVFDGYYDAIEIVKKGGVEE